MPELVRQEMLVVTGMSGAGRSTVADALEDLGWYVVDNLPPKLLPILIDLAQRAGSDLPKLAAVVDIRGRDFFSELSETVASLRSGMDVRVLFLDASDAALVRRFESVRRPHPLQGDGSILDGIAAERIRLAAIRESSDIVIDTSELNVHQLSTRAREIFAEADVPGVRVTIMSFGFKYGTPADADMIVDARFLPNPFWNTELRAFTGEDEAVREFVLAQTGAIEFLDRYAGALEPVLAGYQRENKRHVLIAVGCTGGKHRSVTMTRELASKLAELPGVAVTTTHRDLGRE